MIVSQLHKFIFVAIPKTGTHAIRRALREHMGPHDLEQVGLFVQRSFPMPEIAALGHGHISLKQIRPFLRPDDFQTFFKFAFVRNPFDRFVSYCSFITREKGQFLQNPHAVMWRFLNEPPIQHILFRPQHEFVTDEKGELLSNNVGRVEQMQESYDSICERIGIPTTALDKVNSSKRSDYRQYYDQPLIDAVAKLYARDIELFGYDF